MDNFFNSYDRAQAFTACDSPLLVVDADAVIRDVNPAYLQATSREREELCGTPLFEAFPDNPDDPDARGVAALSCSLETVLRASRRDRMPLLRYDIPSRRREGPFVRKYWMPVNTPVRDERHRVIGVLHHVEDVTRVVDAITDAGLASDGPAPGDHLWDLMLNAFALQVALHDQDRATATQLQHALDSRIVIEQAKGMIATREAISLEEAFERLRRHARCHGARVHDVAYAVVNLRLTV